MNPLKRLFSMFIRRSLVKKVTNKMRGKQTKTRKNRGTRKIHKQRGFKQRGG
jgi:hypothetical protein